MVNAERIAPSLLSNPKAKDLKESNMPIKLPENAPTTDNAVLAFIEKIAVGIASIISGIADPFVQAFSSHL